jgi:ribonuclease HI
MRSLPVQIYTDGSCSPNPGPGGWAAVLLFNQGEKTIELKGAEQQSTNNRMELTAALRALESLDGENDVEILTDSKYLQRGIVEWMKKWKKNGWVTTEGNSVKNRDLWQSFSVQLERHKITWTWIKGHNKNSWNERADELATIARHSLGESTVTVNPSGVHLYPGVTWKHSIASGAWAVVLNYGNHYKCIGGAKSETTANRLYLHAVISGILCLKRTVPVYIHTRSGYLRDGLEVWLDGWRKRDWCTREGTVVSNVELWHQLSKLKEKYSIKIISISPEKPPCHLQEAKELAREFDQ